MLVLVVIQCEKKRQGCHTSDPSDPLTFKTSKIFPGLEVNVLFFVDVPLFSLSE